jgi:hypothetical protein
MAFMSQFLKYLWRPLLDIFKVQNKNRAFEFLRQPCTFSFNILADFHWTLTTLSWVCAVPPPSRLRLRVSHIKLKNLDAFSGHSHSFDLLSFFITSSFDILPFFTLRLIFSLTRSSNVFLLLHFCRFNFICGGSWCFLPNGGVVTGKDSFGSIFSRTQRGPEDRDYWLALTSAEEFRCPYLEFEKKKKTMAKNLF